MSRHVPYYSSFITDDYLSYLLKQAEFVEGVEGLKQVGKNKGLESSEALRFTVNLYNQVKSELSLVLEKRAEDRKRTPSLPENQIKRGKSPNRRPTHVTTERDASKNL